MCVNLAFVFIFWLIATDYAIFWKINLWRRVCCDEKKLKQRSFSIDKALNPQSFKITISEFLSKQGCWKFCARASGLFYGKVENLDFLANTICQICSIIVSLYVRIAQNLHFNIKIKLKLLKILRSLCSQHLLNKTICYFNLYDSD